MASHEWTRVVVLRSAADSPKDARLNAIFAARDWYAIEHANAFQAMAELCLRERTQAARAAWGLQRIERSALVILEPMNERQLFDLVQAAKRHVPGTSVWTWTGIDLEPLAGALPIAPLGGEPPMPRPMPRPITMAGSLESPAAFAPKLPHSPSSAPKPPILAPKAREDRLQESAEEPSASAGRISREEIDMLLRADSEDSSPMPFVPSRQRTGGSGSGS